MKEKTEPNYLLSKCRTEAAEVLPGGVEATMGQVEAVVVVVVVVGPEGDTVTATVTDTVAVVVVAGMEATVIEDLMGVKSKCV